MKTIKTNEETVKKLFLNKVMSDNWYEKIEIVKIENVQDYVDYIIDTDDSEYTLQVVEDIIYNKQ